MNIFKKIIGVLILILAGIFSLGALLNFISLIFEAIIKEDSYTSYDLGYTIGIFSGLILIAILLFYMWKFGFKLIKSKRDHVDSIEEIGNFK